MILMDNPGHEKVVHYGFLKSKRITGNVWAAKHFSITHSFAVLSTIHKAENDMLDRNVPLQVFNNSKRLLKCLLQLSRTSAKRLLFDLTLLRKSYELREIAEDFWIPTDQNLTNAFTKLRSCQALQCMLATNKIKIVPNT